MGTDTGKPPLFHSSYTLLCKCAVAGAAFLVLVLACSLTTRHNSVALRGSKVRSVHVSPYGPPLPYHYETMVEWFKKQAWDKSDLPMPPALSWFDVDMALHGAKASWFSEFSKDNIDQVVAVAKRINRFHFMTRIMGTGRDTTQGGMAVHLLILLLLQPKVYEQRVKVIDIGCGTGWLATAFSVLAGEGSQVYGLDCTAVAADARHFISSPSATEDGVMSRPEILDGDWVVQQLPLPAELTQGLADAINVGFAVAGMSAPELQRAKLLLKPGGVITVPIADESCRPGGDRCAAQLTLLEKVDGALVAKSMGRSVKFFAAGPCN